MNKQREHWGSSFGFVMAAAGSAIGLGTLWQFPYMTMQNGGGIFVLLFLLFTVILGIPLFIGEVLMGRRAARGAVGIFEALSGEGSSWKVTGWLGVAASLFIMAYYCVVSGWGLNYVVMSLCQFYEHRTSVEIAGVFDILFKSGQINVLWQSVFLLVTAGVVYQGIRKGIEYWSKILTSALLVLLLGLLIYSFTLSGFGEAFRYIFYPDFSKLRPSGVLEALGLAFFTLSLGQGVMLTYGSYMRKSDDIPKTAVIIAVMNGVVSIFAALMIFPVVFSFGLKPEGGFGLIFQTLPVLFAKLPGALIISTTFFTLLVFTALTSSVAMLEVLVANFMDLYNWTRKRSVVYSSLAIFLLGLPCALAGSGALFGDWRQIYGKNFFETLIEIIFQWILPIGGVLISLFLGWYMKKEDCRLEFREGATWPGLFGVWYFFVRFVAPICILVIIFHRSGLINLDKLFIF